MPIRFPTAEFVRRQVATEAARLAGLEVEAILPLVGPIEPVEQNCAEDCSWRLSSCSGSSAEISAIERAAGLVQRMNPLIQVHQQP